MYDPDSDETFLDFNDVDKVMASINARRDITQIVKPSTYLTEVNTTDWQDDIEKELTASQSKVLKVDGMIPLDKYPNGEFGIRWCNMKHVFKLLYAHISGISGLNSKGTQSKIRADSFPKVVTNNAKTGIDSVSHRDKLNHRIEAMRQKDKRLNSEETILQTAPTLENRKKAAIFDDKKKSNRLSLKHKTLNTFLPGY